MNETQELRRSYRLVVGTESPSNPGISQLRIVFSVTKNLEKFPNQASIDVYNIQRETRKILEKGIEQVQKAPGKYTPAIKLEVGYTDKNKGILVGNITQVTTKKVGPDIITTFDVGDGVASFTDAKMDVSFSPGATAGQILKSILANMGLTVGQTVGLNSLDQYLNGLTLSGSARDHLTSMLRKQGLGWSIQDNQVQILPPNQSTAETAVLLNKDTGLIDTPFRTQYLNTDKIEDRSKTGSKTVGLSKNIQNGMQVLCLMNPEIKPGRKIKIETGLSDLNSGFFKVTKMRHFGDTHSTPWYTDMIVE